MDGSAIFWYLSNMAGIKNYNLYGERSGFPDVVHCETIEARSRIHAWEFRPHRHKHLHQVLLIESGGGHAVVEEDGHLLEAGAMVNLPAGVVHGFRFIPGTRGWVVTLASEIVEQGGLESEGLRPLLRTPRITGNGGAAREIVRMIFAEFAGQSYARAHVLRALSGVLLGLVARQIAAEEKPQEAQDSGLKARFDALLEEHGLRHLGVSDYAELLGVTPTHLSRVMRAATGQSASAAIEAHVVLQARRNLAFTNLKISEIAYQLGYDDPAYFSRVFRRATGVSPRAFRQGVER
ncbi:MAG: helix-turn-helix domain-containing protein [Silicimonas sp.]|nr:helix-turn-helix domain-containing protein [Silicimonas sp.]